ncbi:hypothetical protein Taro_035166 [Colocasia esculenta]|uniref:Uncharacterized protein n=1 Tax=Colocasia esculenta TaxID=4460 RepID=A0A843WCE4_COLES|nr:hypothetical protein [Colocasia esculenta]
MGSASICMLEAIIANFLGLSAIDANKPLIDVAVSLSHAHARQDAQCAPFNLSLCNTLLRLHTNTYVTFDRKRGYYTLTTTNVSHLANVSLTSDLFAAVGDMEVSKWVLSVLSNVISIGEGVEGSEPLLGSIPDSG